MDAFCAWSIILYRDKQSLARSQKDAGEVKFK